MPLATVALVVIAMPASLDDRHVETDELRFEFRRLTPETTAVVTGQDEFVDETAKTAESNESASVDLPA